MTASVIWEGVVAAIGQQQGRAGVVDDDPDSRVGQWVLTAAVGEQSVGLHHFRLELDDYVTHEGELVPDVDQRLQLVLDRVPRGGRARPVVRPPHPGATAGEAEPAGDEPPAGGDFFRFD